SGWAWMSRRMSAISACQPTMGSTNFMKPDPVMLDDKLYLDRGLSSTWLRPYPYNHPTPKGEARSNGQTLDCTLPRRRAGAGQHRGLPEPARPDRPGLQEARAAPCGGVHGQRHELHPA